MRAIFVILCILLQTSLAEYQDEPDVCEDPNEELKSCGTACEPTCADQNPVCTKQCISNKCQCKSGFLRRSVTDRTCVKKSACSLAVGTTCATLLCNFNEYCVHKQIFCYQAPCPQPPAKCVGPEYQDEPDVCEDPNEELKSCGTACEPTCADQNPVCTKQCISNKCQCKSGFLRRSVTDRTCVKKSACSLAVGTTCATLLCNFNEYCVHKQIFCYQAPCPQPPAKCVGPDDPDFNYGCGNNEKRLSCGTACEPSCKVPNPQICTLQCLVNVCQCVDGTFRDETTKQCVKKCPATGSNVPKGVEGSPGVSSTGRTCADFVCYPGFECQQPFIMCIRAPCIQPEPQCVPKGLSVATHHETNIVPYTGGSSSPSQGTSSYFSTKTQTINGKTVTYTNNNGKKTVTHSNGPGTVTSNTYSNTKTSKGGSVSSTSVRITSTSGSSGNYPSPPTKKCGKNEFFDMCGGCSDLCKDADLLCPALCRPSSAQCRCLGGFRRLNGKCVPVDQCPPTTPKPPTCANGEFYNQCAGGCPDTCDRFGKLCPDVCIGPAKCSCQSRLCRRTPTGPCEAPPPGPPSPTGPSTPGPPTPAPTKKCGQNEFFDMCGGCSDLCKDVVWACSALCRPSAAQCRCLGGFRRLNGKCVPVDQCPSTTPTPPTCGSGEFYNQCAGGCPDTCDRFGKPCPDICIGPAKCTCQSRLCRRTPTGPCVAPPPGPSTPGPQTTTKPPTCANGEFYNQCAGGCPDTCDRFGKPCPDICIGPAKCSCQSRLCRRTPTGPCVAPPPGPPSPSGPSTPGPPTPAPTGGKSAGKKIHSNGPGTVTSNTFASKGGSSSSPFIRKTSTSGSSGKYPSSPPKPASSGGNSADSCDCPAGFKCYQPPAACRPPFQCLFVVPKCIPDEKKPACNKTKSGSGSDSYDKLKKT